MSVETIVEITCDKCKNNIDIKTKYINAGTYGIEICVDCYSKMNAHQLVVLLGLDEIKYMIHDQWADAEKVYAFDGFNYLKINNDFRK